MVVVTLEDIEDVMNEHVLIWACREEAQRAQKLALNNINEAKPFDAVRHCIQKHDYEAPGTK